MNHGAVASEDSGSELVWVKSRYPVLNLGLAHTLQAAFRVHQGEDPPDSDACHYVLAYADS